jgi:SHS2 domain-containing protein
MWEIFEHTADVGIRIRAASLEQLLADAGRALFSLLVANLGEVEPVLQQEVTVAFQPGQYDYLLCDWLSELLVHFDQGAVYCRFDIEIGDTEIRAACRGAALAPARHDLHHEIKAVTYHGLTVQCRDEQWMAEVIVDV